MKKILIILLPLLPFLFRGMPVLAADTEAVIDQQLEASGYYSLFSVLPEEAADLLGEDFSPNLLQELSLGEILTWAVNFIKEKVSAPIALFGSLLAVILLSSLTTALENGGSFRPVVSLILTALLSGTLSETVGKTAGLIAGLSDFMLAFLPVFAASAAASGRPASSLVWYGTTLSAVELFSAAIDRLVLPMIMIFIALSLMSSLSPDLQTADLIRSIRSIALWILSFCLTVFLSLLTIKTAITGATDGVTLKTAKFLLGSAIPVVGSAIGDAWSALSGCLQVVKSTVGVFGLSVIGTVFLPQILYLGSISMLLSFVSGVAAALSEKSAAETLKTAASVVSVLLALIICYAIMLIAAIALVLVTHS